jgi:hypothetical protein
LLADAVPVGSAWPVSLDNLLNTGLAVAYAWYTATRTIPKLIEDNRQDAVKRSEAVEKISQFFRQEVDATRQEYREMLSRSVAECKADREATMAMFLEERAQDRQARSESLQTLRQAMDRIVALERERQPGAKPA